MGTIRQLICDAVEKEYEEANKKYPMTKVSPLSGKRSKK